MSLTLIVMRHAKSRWDEGVSDYDRGLCKRGRRDARAVGKWLDAHDLLPDVGLCSPARRARATAKRVVEHGGYAGEVRMVPDLYEGDADRCVGRLAALPPEIRTVLVIGHNPLLEDMVLSLTSAAVTLSTAALVCVRFDADAWSRLARTRGRIVLDLRPRELST